MKYLGFLGRLFKAVFGTITYEPPAFWNPNKAEKTETLIEDKEEGTITQTPPKEQPNRSEPLEKTEDEETFSPKKKDIETEQVEKSGIATKESVVKRRDRPSMPLAVKILLPVILVGIIEVDPIPWTVFLES